MIPNEEPTPAPGAEPEPQPAPHDTVPIEPSPPPEQAEQEAPPEPAAPPPEPPPPPKPKPESRFKRFLKRLLWTTLALLVAFAAGAVLTWWQVYRPAQAQIADLQRQVQEVEQRAADLEVQKADLEGKLQRAQEQVQDLTQEVQALQAEREALQNRAYVLSALADTYAAQMALAAKDPTSARLYLSNVKASLRLLEERLPEQKAVLTEMNQRVEKAMSILAASPLTAQGDLEALASYLTQLENLLVSP